MMNTVETDFSRDKLAAGIHLRMATKPEVVDLRVLSRHIAFGGDSAPDLIAIIKADPDKLVGWIAEVNGKIVGFALAHEQAEALCHVLMVREHDQWRDCGITRRLAEEVAGHARNSQCLKVVLHRVLNSMKSIEFMHRFGFFLGRKRVRPEGYAVEFYLDLYRSKSDPAHQG